MLISYVKLDHALYSINYGIDDLIGCYTFLWAMNIRLENSFLGIVLCASGG